MGPTARFQLPTLAEQVGRYFQRENPKSFEPAKRPDLAALPIINRPTCHRELFVRRNWVARHILADQFPAPPSSAAIFELAPEQEAERQDKADFQRRKRAAEEAGAKDRAERVRNSKRSAKQRSLSPRI